MYVVLLKFAENRAAAGAHMDGHNAWVAKGFEDGIFLMAGSLKPGLGGAVLARGEDRAALEARIAADPFVAEGVVSAEIHEIAPARADERLQALIA